MDLKDYSKKLVGTDEERAVSPVIGVILMVAITVILAAVIAAFVLDMGGSQSTNAQAGLDVSENSNGTYTVTVTSMSDNTKGVYCGQTSHNYTEEVGGEILCTSGDSVTGNTTDGGENVLQSNVGE